MFKPSIFSRTSGWNGFVITEHHGMPEKLLDSLRSRLQVNYPSTQSFYISKYDKTSKTLRFSELLGSVNPME